MQDSNHCIEAAVQLDWFADSRRIGSHASAPERIPDHRNVASFIGLGVEASRERDNAAERIEEVAARPDHPGGLAVAAGSPRPDRDGIVRGELLKYTGRAE